MDRFLPIVLCMVAMYGGCQLFGINHGKTTESQKSIQKDFCEKGVRVNAFLQNEYSVLESGDVSVSYSYKFDYDVAGKTYTGEVTKDEPLTSTLIVVTYHSENPEQVSATDPCVRFERIKDQASPWPKWFEYVGAGIFILGLGYAQSSLVYMIRGK